MTDKQFFEMLNLDYLGMAKVKAAVEAGDMPAAKHEFAEHLRQREKPVYTFDWRARPKLDSRPANAATKEADLVLNRNVLWAEHWQKFEGEIDWNCNPINYREWTWGLNLHWHWNTLGKAYWATGEEKYAREFVYQMTDWVRRCPVPLNNDGNQSNSWRTIETGRRMGGSWPDAFFQFLSSPSFTDDAIVTMVGSMTDHARHLMRWPTNANWLLFECNGLMHVGVLFPEFKEAAEWRKTAADRLYVELDKQVYPDGAQIELSTGYHQHSLMSFMDAWKIAHINDVPMPRDYVAKMGKMLDYDVAISMPNLRVPGLNDAGEMDMSVMLGRGLAFFPQRKDYEWVATARKEGKKPAFTSIALPWSGHIVMRSGWEPDSLYSLLDAGPFGWGHHHEDALSMIIYAYGKYLLVDPGGYYYDSSEWRKYVVSTRAHNTVMVDDLPQHRAGLPRLQYVVEKPLPIRWATNHNYDYAVGSYDDGYGVDNAVRVKHTRRVFFVKPEYWILTDTMTPADGKPHKYDFMFHLDAAGADVDAASKAVHTTNTDAANLTIWPAAAKELTVNVISGQEKPMVQGWVPAPGHTCRPIPTPVFETSGSGAQTVAYVLYPTPAGKKCPATSVQWLAEGCGVSIAFDNGRLDSFAWGDDSGTHFQTYEGDGEAVYTRTEGQKTTKAVMVGGTKLMRGSKRVNANIVPVDDLSNTTVRHNFTVQPSS